MLLRNTLQIPKESIERELERGKLTTDVCLNSLLGPFDLKLFACKVLIKINTQLTKKTYTVKTSKRLNSKVFSLKANFKVRNRLEYAKIRN